MDGAESAEEGELEVEEGEIADAGEEGEIHGAPLVPARYVVVGRGLKLRNGDLKFCCAAVEFLSVDCLRDKHCTGLLGYICKP